MAFSESVRLEIFNRAKGRCEKCGKQLVYANHLPGEKGAWQAHHIVSQKSGGKDIASNGMALCLACHVDRTEYGKHN